MFRWGLLGQFWFCFVSLWGRFNYHCRFSTENFYFFLFQLRIVYLSRNPSILLIFKFMPLVLKKNLLGSVLCQFTSSTRVIDRICQMFIYFANLLKKQLLVWLIVSATLISVLICLIRCISFLLIALISFCFSLNWMLSSFLSFLFLLSGKCI